jgi:hypothetical protein
LDGLNGLQLSFKDVLSRLPQLRDVYERSFPVPASNYRAFVFALLPSYVDIDVFGGRYGLPSQDDLRVGASIPDEVAIMSTDRHNFVPREEHLSYRVLIENSDIAAVSPHIQIGNSHDTSIIVPFYGGKSLSHIGRLFLLSFFLGTLARYHPTTWLGVMQSRQKGDFMLPIIRDSMGVIQSEFAELVLIELERPTGVIVPGRRS